MRVSTELSEKMRAGGYVTISALSEATGLSAPTVRDYVSEGHIKTQTAGGVAFVDARGFAAYLESPIQRKLVLALLEG